MKLVSFCILTALSLLYAGLTIAETLTYHQWEKAINDQRYTQAQVAYFDHLNGVLDEMVRRMAVLSQHDPAMTQLLKDHNIHVVIDKDNPPPSTPPATSGFDQTPPVNPSAAPATKSQPAPATSTSPQQ